MSKNPCSAYMDLLKAQEFIEEVSKNPESHPELPEIVEKIRGIKRRLAEINNFKEIKSREELKSTL